MPDTLPARPFYRGRRYSPPLVLVATVLRNRPRSPCPAARFLLLGLLPLAAPTAEKGAVGQFFFALNADHTLDPL